MFEDDSTAIVDAENLDREPTRTSQPTLPMERRSVQLTIVFLAVFAVAAILWSGRTTFWRESGQDLVRPAVLLQIDINQASDREFALLPGIGPVLAKRIVDDRQQNGSFSSIEDLSRIHGIGPKTLDRIAVYCLPVGAADAMVVAVGD